MQRSSIIARMDRSISDEKSVINLSTLPIELLVYIISFISSLRDRVKLRYISKWLRCVIEGTPSLWKEFVWHYCDIHEERSVKETLKVCAQHIRVLSLPNSRTISSTLVDMLQYCSNVQHLSLPSTKLDPEQLKNTIHHMGHLQTLELKVDNYNAIRQLLLNTCQLKELTIFSSTCHDYLVEMFKYWKGRDFRPSNVNVIVPVYYYGIECLLDYTTRLKSTPACVTANFRVYNRSSKIPLNQSTTLPYFQLHYEGSAGKVAIPSVELSSFCHDLAAMTECQYGGRTDS